MPADWRIIDWPASRLDEYARIPCSFLRADGRRKDYDAIPGNHPTDWARHRDLNQWWIAAAMRDDEAIGGAMVRFDDPGPHVAVLWDLRVCPNQRRRGIGSMLFEAASQIARERGCRQLKIETQDINVAACAFYARHGCTLVETNPAAYAEFPEETQLIWKKALP